MNLMRRASRSNSVAPGGSQAKSPAVVSAEAPSSAHVLKQVPRAQRARPAASSPSQCCHASAPIQSPGVPCLTAVQIEAELARSGMRLLRKEVPQPSRDHAGSPNANQEHPFGMVHHRREDCSVSLLEPNRSVEATSHGGAAWPGNGYFVYSPFPGQAAPPRAAPHLER
jgi:hypothetical protein